MRAGEILRGVYPERGARFFASLRMTERRAQNDNRLMYVTLIRRRWRRVSRDRTELLQGARQSKPASLRPGCWGRPPRRNAGPQPLPGEADQLSAQVVAGLAPVLEGDERLDYLCGQRVRLADDARLRNRRGRGGRGPR